MWLSPDTKREISVLKDCVRELEIALEREKSTRMADKLELLGKMEAIHGNLASSISGLRTAEKPVQVARNGSAFRNFAEKEEGVNA